MGSRELAFRVNIQEQVVIVKMFVFRRKAHLQLILGSKNRTEAFRRSDFKVPFLSAPFIFQERCRMKIEPVYFHPFFKIWIRLSQGHFCCVHTIFGINKNLIFEIGSCEWADRVSIQEWVIIVKACSISTRFFKIRSFCQKTISISTRFFFQNCRSFCQKAIVARWGLLRQFPLQNSGSCSNFGPKIWNLLPNKSGTSPICHIWENNPTPSPGTKLTLSA